MPRHESHGARPDLSYLITGGTGGLGLSIARWLAQQGAKNIILASQSGGAADSVRMMLEEHQSLGVKIKIYKCDIADEAELRALVLKSRRDMPRIGGVIHGAMVLKVSILPHLLCSSDYNLNLFFSLPGQGIREVCD